MLSGDMWKLNYLEDNMLTNEVTINFNMFGLLMKHWISGYLDSTNVISI